MHTQHTLVFGSARLLAVFVAAGMVSLGACKGSSESSKSAESDKPAAAQIASGKAAAGGAVESDAKGPVRAHIDIVGSSTVYPFATVVAEHFGKATNFPTPKVESTGSGGGLKLFCAGVGTKHPDIANSSRRIKQTELDQCAQNGVQDVIEVKLGYDGIVLAQAKSAPPANFTLAQIWLALAKEVPAPDGSGEFVTNPYQQWQEIDASLPAERIEVLGPPPTSGTRDAFVELAMEAGCAMFEPVRALEETDQDRFKAVCQTVREDGLFIEAGENDNLIVQKLDTNPRAFGIFGFSFLDQNADKIRGSSIGGVEPSFDNIASAKYPVSRPLYFYVKKAHIDVVPGIREYLREFTSEQAWGPSGYLADKGMIPLGDSERKEVAANVNGLSTLVALQ